MLGGFGRLGTRYSCSAYWSACSWASASTRSGTRKGHPISAAIPHPVSTATSCASSTTAGSGPATTPTPPASIVIFRTRVCPSGWPRLKMASGIPPASRCRIFTSRFAFMRRMPESCKRTVCGATRICWPAWSIMVLLPMGQTNASAAMPRPAMARHGKNYSGLPSVEITWF